MFSPNSAARHNAAASLEARATASEHRTAQLEQALHQLHQQLQAQSAAPQQLSVAPAAGITPAELVAAVTAAVTAAASTDRIAPLDLSLRFEGYTGLAFRDWLEKLEVHHTFSRRSDAQRVEATVALLTGNALKAHLQSVKSLGQPHDYAALLARLEQTWRLNLPFGEQYKRLMLVVAHGPKLKKPEAYVREFSIRAGEIDDDDMNQSTKILLFINGLPASHRAAIIAKHHTTLHAALQQALERLANQSEAGIDSSPPSATGGASYPSESSDMDVSASEFNWMSIEDRAVASHEGLPEHDTSSSSSISSSSKHKGKSRSAAAADAPSAMEVAIANIVAAQLAAAGVSRYHRSSTSSSSGGSAKEVSAPLAAARKAHGWCIKCGVVKYVKSPGHNASNCQATPDKTRWPAGMSESDKKLFQ